MIHLLLGEEKREEEFTLIQSFQVWANKIIEKQEAQLRA